MTCTWNRLGFGLDVETANTAPASSCLLPAKFTFLITQSSVLPRLSVFYSGTRVLSCHTSMTWTSVFLQFCRLDYRHLSWWPCLKCSVIVRSLASEAVRIPPKEMYDDWTGMFVNRNSCDRQLSWPILRCFAYSYSMCCRGWMIGVRLSQSVGVCRPAPGSRPWPWPLGTVGSLHWGEVDGARNWFRLLGLPCRVPCTRCLVWHSFGAMVKTTKRRTRFESDVSSRCWERQVLGIARMRCGWNWVQRWSAQGRPCLVGDVSQTSLWRQVVNIAHFVSYCDAALQMLLCRYDKRLYSPVPPAGHPQRFQGSQPLRASTGAVRHRVVHQFACHGTLVCAVKQPTNQSRYMCSRVSYSGRAIGLTALRRTVQWVRRPEFEAYRYVAFHRIATEVCWIKCFWLSQHLLGRTGENHDEPCRIPGLRAYNRTGTAPRYCSTAPRTPALPCS
jgi:hypothetical protein